MRRLEYYKHIFKSHGLLVLINEISCDIFKYSSIITVLLLLYFVSRIVFENIYISIVLSTNISIFVYRTKKFQLYFDNFNYLKNRN